MGHSKEDMQQFESSSIVSGPKDLNVSIPGDKSISHRSMIFGLLSRGTTTVKGLLEGDDILATAEACRKLGAKIIRRDDGVWEVTGVGVGCLSTPHSALDFGNAGTGSRLMMGVVAGHPITATFDGDASLRSRPMKRVLDPLMEMGASVEFEIDDRLPCKLSGTLNPMPKSFKQKKASAQVKSAILLAALNTPGEVTYIEPIPTRDHTENMMRGFGANITVMPLEGEEGQQGGNKIVVTGEKQLTAQDIQVPSDPSSSAFIIAAALIVPDSDIIIENVLMNETRIGVITTWLEMGANIEIMNERLSGGEKIADLRVQYSELKGVSVPAERAASMIDEYPILAMTAAYATGKTHMQELDELRVKESDRLSAVYNGLIANGVKAEIIGDDLIVHGGAVQGGGIVETHLDHRIAMCFLILGLQAQTAVAIDDGTMIATSFPEFLDVMNAFGAKIKSI